MRPKLMVDVPTSPVPNILLEKLKKELGSSSLLLSYAIFSLQSILPSKVATCFCKFLVTLPTEVGDMGVGPSRLLALSEKREKIVNLLWIWRNWELASQSSPAHIVRSRVKVLQEILIFF